MITLKSNAENRTWSSPVVTHPTGQGLSYTFVSYVLNHNLGRSIDLTVIFNDGSNGGGSELGKVYHYHHRGPDHGGRAYGYLLQKESNNKNTLEVLVFELASQNLDVYFKLHSFGGEYNH